MLLSVVPNNLVRHFLGWVGVLTGGESFTGSLLLVTNYCRGLVVGYKMSAYET